MRCGLLFAASPDVRLRFPPIERTRRPEPLMQQLTFDNDDHNNDGDHGELCEMRRVFLC